MKFTFRNVEISGMLVVLPEHESRFEDEIPNYDFPTANSLKLRKVIGLDRHRVVEGQTCASDLAIHGLRHLFERGWLTPEGIDVLIVVTETPDYFMPPTSNVIQGKLGLGTATWCVDINQGCAGFVVGLIEGCMLLKHTDARTVVLINADTLSRTCSKHDRNSYPLIGDAASITVLRRSDQERTVHAEVRMDGSQHQAIMIPAGGFRMPKSEATGQPLETNDGNVRSLENYHMDGLAVLNFVLTNIPELLRSLFQSAGCLKEDVDWYMCHQPNRFMLEKLADELGVPREKMPNDIVQHYGNASSATIPTALMHALGSELLKNRYRTCLCGFGVGLTWGAALCEVGPLQFAEFVNYPNGATSG